jgi:myo-inositol-1(or 4)-monophosphatase
MAAPTALLSTIGEALAEATQIALHERKSLKSELKPDGSIVTNVDVAVDTFLEGVLTSALPDADYWGEEAGFRDGPERKSDLWLVDPVDGTSNFRFGLPLWGISIGLLRNGRLLAGGIALPDLGETYLAIEGHGATLNGQPLTKIKSGPIEAHELVSVSENLIKRHPSGNWPGKMRLCGAFVIDAMFVASGRFRGLIGRREKLYDAAASVVICREVGAVVNYADGSAWNEAAYVENAYLERPWMIFPESSGWTLKED